MMPYPFPAGFFQIQHRSLLAFVKWLNSLTTSSPVSGNNSL